MKFERVEIKNSRQLTLIGNFYAAPSDGVIIMCHGFTSDKSSRGRFDRFALRFQASGFHVLAFDFSGCGESDDDSLTMAKQADDLQAAIAFVKRKGLHKIALYGHSLGSRICLMSYSKDIQTMVLTGASTGGTVYDWNEHFTPVQMKELRETGKITQLLTNGPRKKVIIEQQMLDDFEQCNQKKLLSSISCPVLIIHGNHDREEKMLSDKSREGMKFLSKESKLVIINGAAHSFMGYLDVVEELSMDWLLQHLKA
ncbi:alpha/beta hydrolase [Metabacillus idriensis]|uniref:Alpha/beta fold hydrolase n=1 Tax=Metabacillus idriensis TaxID=324768 RepID=A0A6I2ME90_9BACI|nr:alpha/beta hydrolase [Metabacillus idriensis]MCM3597077.1 alpha/beta hydrolase [Metabacillus idriensis]MRX55562.1 alpha/beta fold hydrolase [Metabacillus idriensis]OHR67396.1 hypothetical protein HMPREF3291_10825 [Bacillus sp. HMSC76G11]